MEVAAVIYTLYAFEKNTRTENHPGLGFYVTIYGDWSRCWMDSMKDSAPTILRETPGMLVERVTFDYAPCWHHRYHSPSLDQLMEQLHEREFNHPRMELFMTHNPYSGVALGKTLEQLHANETMFRIERVWDVGFDVFIIDPAVRPLRMELDNINGPIYEQSKDTKSEDYVFLPLPERDWLHAKDNVQSLQEVIDWLLQNG
jgi:hypothetical protein